MNLIVKQYKLQNMENFEYFTKVFYYSCSLLKFIFKVVIIILWTSITNNFLNILDVCKSDHQIKSLKGIFCFYR